MPRPNLLSIGPAVVVSSVTYRVNVDRFSGISIFTGRISLDHRFGVTASMQRNVVGYIREVGRPIYCMFVMIRIIANRSISSSRRLVSPCCTTSESVQCPRQKGRCTPDIVDLHIQLVFGWNHHLFWFAEVDQGGCRI